MLPLVSFFCSIKYQATIIRKKLAAGQTIEQILAVSAAPGFSEHHTGRCLDLATPNSRPLEEEFENTSAFAWLMEHALPFGFTLSYPRNNPHHVIYEPWHWLWNGE